VRTAGGSSQGRRRDGAEAGPTEFSAENYRWVDSQSNIYNQDY
jgi:hypothetical protein